MFEVLKVIRTIIQTLYAINHHGQWQLTLVIGPYEASIFIHSFVFLLRRSRTTQNISLVIGDNTPNSPLLHIKTHKTSRKKYKKPSLAITKMSAANEFHVATVIDATGCSNHVTQYWLPIAAKRLSTRCDREDNIRLSLVYVFFQKSNLF